MTFISPENITGIDGIFVYANTVSNNVFGIGILLSLFLIIMFYAKNNGESLPDSMTAAGFVSCIVGVLLLVIGVINSWHFFICVSVTVLSALWSYINKSV